MRLRPRLEPDAPLPRLKCFQGGKPPPKGYRFNRTKKVKGTFRVLGEVRPKFFHHGQGLAWESRARDIVVTAGSQGGKTAMQAYWLLREIQRCAAFVKYLWDSGLGETMAIYAGPTLQLLRAQALKGFKRVFEEEFQLGKLIMSPKPVFRFSKSGLQRLFGFCDCPFEVVFAYTNDSSNLEAMTACVGVWDEAGQKENKLESYEAFNRRLSASRSNTVGKMLDWIEGSSERVKKQLAWWVKLYGKEDRSATFGRRLWGTTPYIWGWFKHEIYDRAEREEPGWQWFNFPTWMNPIQNEAEIRAVMDRMPAWRAKMMYEGIYTKPAGLIYDCFDYKVHTVDDETVDIKPWWRIYPGVDFGLRNVAGVLVAQRVEREDLPDGTFRDTPFDEYYVIRDYLATDPEDMARATGGDKSGRRPTTREHVHAIADGHQLRPGAGGAHGEQDSRENFTKEGLTLEEPPANDVAVQVGCVYGALKDMKLRFFRKGAQKTIAEIQIYSNELDDQQEPTDKIEDKAKFHRMDALRYIVTKLLPPATSTFESAMQALRQQMATSAK